MDAGGAGPIGQSLRDAADRGTRWILGHQRADGSLTRPEDGIGGYYKVPYLLSSSGRLREAHKLIDWIGAHHLTPEGDFRAPERRAAQQAHTRWPVYANAWIVLGAFRAMRYDVAHRGERFIRSCQSPSGAFPARDGDREYVEPVNTAWGGLACLAAGDHGGASRAAGVMIRMVERQPDPARFYSRASLDGELVTTIPPGQERAFVVDSRSERQVTYNPGIALIFLAHVLRSRDDSGCRDACAWLSGFAARCSPETIRYPPSGKLGLGCALWFAITGDEAARGVARDVAAYLLDTQRDDGSWRLPAVEPYVTRPGSEDFETRLDLTAEFATFLLEMSALLTDAR